MNPETVHAEVANARRPLTSYEIAESLKADRFETVRTLLRLKLAGRIAARNRYGTTYYYPAGQVSA